jgi:HSP20 family protein
MRRFADEIDPFFAGFCSQASRIVREPLPHAGGRAVDAHHRDVLRERAMVVRELPGMIKEEVKVEIIKGVLTIEGERKYEKEITKKGYFTTERAYGTFYRQIPLPEEAKIGEAKATFKNGVLEVVIPAPALEKEVARKLEIKAV